MVRMKEKSTFENDETTTRRHDRVEETDGIEENMTYEESAIVNENDHLEYVEKDSSIDLIHRSRESQLDSASVNYRPISARKFTPTKPQMKKKSSMNRNLYITWSISLLIPFLLAFSIAVYNCISFKNPNSTKNGKIYGSLSERLRSKEILLAFQMTPPPDTVLVLFQRHAESLANKMQSPKHIVKNKFKLSKLWAHGMKDPELSNQGLKQAGSCNKWLKRNNLNFNSFDFIFTSPLHRAQQTALHVTDGLRPPEKKILVIPELAEVYHNDSDSIVEIYKSMNESSWEEDYSIVETNGTPTQAEGGLDIRNVLPRGKGLHTIIPTMPQIRETETNARMRFERFEDHLIELYNKNDCHKVYALTHRNLINSKFHLSLENCEMVGFLFNVKERTWTPLIRRKLKVKG